MAAMKKSGSTTKSTKGASSLRNTGKSAQITASVKVTGARVKAAADRTAARNAVNQEKAVARKNAAADRSAANTMARTQRKSAADTKLTSGAGYARYAAKNTGANADTYRSYLRDQIKAMGERGYQNYVKKNPNATRSDYSAYAKENVKNMAARARAKKTGM